MKSTHKKEDKELVSGIIAGIRQREPILDNPEGLTEDIMSAIRENKKANPAVIIEIPRNSTVLTIMLRLMAAASVCLFLLFGYEEYIVVDKISRLEKQNSAISRSSRYQAALQLKKAVSIFAADPVLLNQYKEIKSSKMFLSTLFRAAIYYDVNGISPDALKLQDMTDYNVGRSAVISVLKQFDSTHHSIKK